MKLITSNRLIAAFAAALVLLSSCTSKKDILYLQDMDPGILYEATMRNEVKVRPGDKLRITVSSKNPLLAAPFNATVSVNAEGNVEERSVGAEYKVDPEGNITFPVLGLIHVADLTLLQVRDLIKKLIEEGNYIKDPIVNVDLINLRYTVLGAVGSNGSFSSEDDRITLFEAIANAGDVTSNAQLDHVMVIREENGGRTMYSHDLRSKAIFESPCYYLQQNDIIYVEPKNLKENHARDEVLKYLTLILSTLGVTSSIIIAVRRY